MSLNRRKDCVRYAGLDARSPTGWPSESLFYCSPLVSDAEAAEEANPTMAFRNLTLRGLLLAPREVLGETMAAFEHTNVGIGLEPEWIASAAARGEGVSIAAIVTADFCFSAAEVPPMPARRADLNF